MARTFDVMTSVASSLLRAGTGFQDDSASFSIVAELLLYDFGASRLQVDAAKEAGLVIVNDNLDECTLCDLCLEAAPKGSIEIVKLYEA